MSNSYENDEHSQDRHAILEELESELGEVWQYLLLYKE